MDVKKINKKYNLNLIDENNTTLAECVKHEREKNNLSQRELARRTQIANSLISRIENGEIKKPKYEVLKKISDVLNLEIVQVLSIAGYTSEECMQLGLISNFVGLKGTSKINKYIVLENGHRFVDLIKVLEDYKKGNLNISELFGLFMCRTNIDLTKYVTEEQRKQYGLDKMIEIINKKNE